MTDIKPIAGRLAPALADLFRAGRLQALSSLTAVRTPETLTLRIGVNLPTIPVIELFRSVDGDRGSDLVPANLVATRFPVLAGPAEQFRVGFAELTPGTLYWYRITLAPGPWQRAPVVDIGQIGTLDRQLRVQTNLVQMTADGDEMTRGEITFSLGLLAVGSRNLLGTLTSREYSIGDGTLVPGPFALDVIVADHVPTPVLVGMVASEDDYPDMIYPGLGLDLSVIDWGWPFTRGIAIWETEFDTHASAMQQIDLPATPGAHTGPLRLASRLGPLMFDASGSWTCTVTDPHPFVGKARRQRMGMNGAAARGGVVRALSTAGTKLALHLDPAGRLQRVTDEGTVEQAGAAVLTHLLVTPGTERSLDLVALDEEGTLLHTRLARPETDTPDWARQLAAAMGLPAALRGSDGRLHLALADEQGQLHLGVAGDPESWRVAEGRFHSAPLLVAPVDAAVHVAAMSIDGDWVSIGPVDGRGSWQTVALEGRRLLALDADPIGNVQVLALDDEDQLHVRDLDPAGHWQDLGPFSALWA